MSATSVPGGAERIRQGSSIGQPLTRRDGPLKVTGQATFAADNHPDGMLFAVLAVSSIARGRVAEMNLAAARAHPGVVEVMTPANRPPLAGDPRAFAQATWRHLLFGVVLGELERRLNPPAEPVTPMNEATASTNGHGSVEHLVASAQ